MFSDKTKFITVCFVLTFAILEICSECQAKIDAKSIVGIWLMESDKEVVDMSKNGNNGEVKGSLKLVDGKFGKALLYPGQKDSFVEIKHNSSLDLTTFSFVMWVKLNPTNTYQCVIAKTTDGLTENYTGYLMDNSKVFWTRFTSGGATKWGFQKFGVTPITDDSWHHLAGTYDMKSVKSYVDGKVEANAPFEGKPDANTGPLTIGACTGMPYPVNGIMDEVALFSSALTEDDIKDIMNNGLTRVTAVTLKDKLTTTWGIIKKF
ncbi:MAG: LamG domain-containing protein [bacterium]